MVLFLLFIVSCVSQSNVKRDGKTFSEEDQKQQEAVELLKQEKWEQAASTLMDLKVKYKDNKTFEILHCYAWVKQQLNNNNPAPHLLLTTNDIPNDYNGPLADEILLCKKHVENHQEILKGQEELYQKIINSVMAEKWEEGEYLNWLVELNYKDAKPIRDYTRAQKYKSENNLSLAKITIEKVSDNYNGPMKEQILSFKHNLVNKKETELQTTINTTVSQDQYKPQKIVDTNEKQIWKVYISSGQLHFTGTYKGTGNFIVKLSDSNQNLVEVIANEIGDYVADKIVSVDYVGWYYLEVHGTYGEWTYQWNNSVFNS